MRAIIDYFGGEKKFYIVMVVLIIMWLLLLGFFYLKADEVTKNPCSVCAKKQQENVVCSVGSIGGIVSRTYYTNYSVYDYP